MPRLRDRSVLDEGILDLPMIWQTDAFALAAGYDEAADRYTACGPPATKPPHPRPLTRSCSYAPRSHRLNATGSWRTHPSPATSQKPEDFKGKTLGVWFSGNEYPFLSWMSKLKLSTEGGPDGVTVIKQGFNVDPLIQKQADCISTMTYNEYWQVIDAGIPADELTVFKYEDQGVATLEDGLYVLDKSLDDPKMVETLAKFVKASMKGWAYAAENPDEAAEIVLDNDMTGAQTEEHQAHGRRDQQAGRRLRRHARYGGSRKHRDSADGRWFRSRDHQEAGRRLEPEGDGRDEKDVTRPLIRDPAVCFATPGRDCEPARHAALAEG